MALIIPKRRDSYKSEYGYSAPLRNMFNVLMMIGRRLRIGMGHNVFMVFLLLVFVSPGGVIGNNQGELLHLPITIMVSHKIRN